MTLISACGGKKIKVIGSCVRHIHVCSACYPHRYKYRPKLRNSTVDLNSDSSVLLGLQRSPVYSKPYIIVRPVSSGSQKKSYYDILCITSKATQAQVKKAYYDLSKTYHPDQYKGQEDAALKFREITEAYEVLGNYQKRRMYDKGLLTFGVAATPKEADEYASKFYESRSKRGKMPSATGRTPIYNFDEWSKSHYEEAFERKQSAKNMYEGMKDRQEKDIEKKKTETAMYVILLIGAAVLFHTSMKNDFDNLDNVKNPSKPL